MVGEFEVDSASLHVSASAECFMDPSYLFPLVSNAPFFSSFRFIEHKMMSDASEMLAAALEQMDGIIAGNFFVHLDFKTWQ